MCGVSKSLRSTDVRTVQENDQQETTSTTTQEHDGFAEGLVVAVLWSGVPFNNISVGMFSSQSSRCVVVYCTASGRWESE